MEVEVKRAAFDAEKETDLYKRDSNGQNHQRALRQILIVLIVLFSVSVGVFSTITWLQQKESQGLTGSSLIEYDGLTFEYIEESSEIAALQLTTPFSESDRGDYLAILGSPSEVKGCAVYRLQSIPSKALLLVNKNGAYALYRFCYFSDAGAHTGQDILEVCGSESILKSIACYGVTRSDSYDEWEETISDRARLNEFEELFGALTPIDAGDSITEQINQSGSWDVIVTLQYENGLTFNLCLYNELKVITGFRCVYQVSDEMIGLLEQNE